MAKSIFNGKRVTAFLLCLIMMFTIFTFNPVEAAALEAPVNFEYNQATGLFTWQHVGPADLLTTFEIRGVFAGADIPLGSTLAQTISIANLATQSLPFNWMHAEYPMFTAYVVAQRAGVTSAISNTVRVELGQDIDMGITISVSGTTLSWQSTRPGSFFPAGMVFRIYAGDVFRTAVQGTTQLDLGTLNFTPGSTYNLTLRAINPNNFTMSPMSNNVWYQPPAQGFPITVAAVGAGSVQTQVNSVTANNAPANSNVTLTAIPNTGAAFSHWEATSAGVTIFDNRANPVTFVMPAHAVSVRAHFNDFGVGNQQIIVTRNNDQWGTAVSNVAASPANNWVELTATPASGFRFVRWEVLSGNVTFVDANTRITHFQMPVGNVQVRAVFEQGAPSTITAGNRSDIPVVFTQSAGNVTLDLPATKVTEILTATTPGGNAIFDLYRLDQVTTVTMPRVSLNQFANANVGVELRLAHGTISINRQAVASLVAQAYQAVGTNISVTMHIMGRAALNLQQQQALSTFDTVYNFRINSLNQTITNFEGVITLTVPYTGQEPVSVRRMLENGAMETLTSTHNSTARTVQFLPPNPALYVVGQATPPPPQPPGGGQQPPPQPPTQPVTNPFTDVHSNQWFYDDVMFVYANNIMGATSLNPTVFSPNANLTRGMIVTILHRREGTPDVTANNPFNDVSSTAWFADAVVWAANAGIVTGVGAGRFEPNANITRQDLAVILIRYADYIGANLPIVTTYRDFADQNRIAAYARAAVREAVEAGIITGRAGNIFAPVDNSTRSETAAMLHRFINAIS